MYAFSTALVLASLGAGTLAAPFNGLFFTSSDTGCVLIGSPVMPADGAKGQFSSGAGAVKSQLQTCTLYVREEGPDGTIEEDPVLVIDAGDRECHELPGGKLHWNAECEGGEGDDDDEE